MGVLLCVTPALPAGRTPGTERAPGSRHHPRQDSGHPQNHADLRGTRWFVAGEAHLSLHLGQARQLHAGEHPDDPSYVVALAGADHHQAGAEQAAKDRLKIEWGSQIRSYVLFPYQQVADHRTDVKTSNVDGILDGDLDGLIRTFLLQEGSEQQRGA